MKKIVYFGVLYREHILEARVCPTLDKEEAIARMREESESYTEYAQGNPSFEHEDKISEYRVEGYAFDEDVDPAEYEYQGRGEPKEIPTKVFFQVVRKADEEYIKEYEDAIEKREADGCLQRILRDEVYNENGKDISTEYLNEKIFEKAKKHGIDPIHLKFFCD